MNCKYNYTYKFCLAPNWNLIKMKMPKSFLAFALFLIWPLLLSGNSMNWIQCFHFFSPMKVQYMPLLLFNYNSRVLLFKATIGKKSTIILIGQCYQLLQHRQVQTSRLVLKRHISLVNYFQNVNIFLLHKMIFLKVLPSLENVMHPMIQI